MGKKAARVSASLLKNSLAQRNLARRNDCEVRRAQEAEPAQHGLLVVTRTLLLLVPLLLASPATASAYTDPGTGAFMYQAAYAAFLGGSFYLRRLLKRFWYRRKDSKEL